MAECPTCAGTGTVMRVTGRPCPMHDPYTRGRGCYCHKQPAPCWDCAGTGTVPERPKGAA